MLRKTELLCDQQEWFGPLWAANGSIYCLWTHLYVHRPETSSAVFIQYRLIALNLHFNYNSGPIDHPMDHTALPLSLHDRAEWIDQDWTRETKKRPMTECECKDPPFLEPP